VIIDASKITPKSKLKRPDRVVARARAAIRTSS
jgi:hypothetical protein